MTILERFSAFPIPDLILELIYPLFKILYTQKSISTFFSPKNLYTHRIHISENDLLEFCFFFYFLFSPPQAPPNAIFQRLIQFPFISDASRQDLTRHSSEIPNIHISKTAQKPIIIHKKLYEDQKALT